jgi:hypothetical protein
MDFFLKAKRNKSTIISIFQILRYIALNILIITDSIYSGYQWTDYKT